MSAQRRPYRPRGDTSAGTRVPPPAWEGTYGFRRVWEDCQAQLFDTPPLAYHGGEEVIDGSDVVATLTLRALAVAHPIYIGTEQISALPPVEADPMRIIREATLPFPTIFLDFASARGPARLPLVFRDGSRYETELYGALVADEDPETRTVLAAARAEHPGTGAMSLVGGRVVVPLGCGIAGREADGLVVETGPDDAVRYPANCDSIATAMAAGAPMGVVSTTSPGGAPGNSIITGELRGGDRPDMDLGMATYAAISYRGFELLGRSLAEELTTPIDPRGDPGYFIGGTGAVLQDAMLAKQHGDEERLDLAHQELALQALFVRAQVEYVARALYLLTAANVHVAPAPVSRQVRRAAERSGAEIASVVTVRRTQVRRPGVVSRQAGHRDFSHRFERRAHYRHVTSGPHYKPDHVAPCDRRDEDGELTCPNGCRREYVPAHWVGADHLPMVPKARVVAIPPPEEPEDA